MKSGTSEGVCSKWANLFPFSPNGRLFVPRRTNDRKGEVHVWSAAARSSLDQDKIETCTDMQRIVIASHSHFMQKPSKTTEGYILESDFLDHLLRKKWLNSNFQPNLSTVFKMLDKKAWFPSLSEQALGQKLCSAPHSRQFIRTWMCICIILCEHPNF